MHVCLWRVFIARSLFFSCKSISAVPSVSAVGSCSLSASVCCWIAFVAPWVSGTSGVWGRRVLRSALATIAICSSSQIARFQVVVVVVLVLSNIS